VRARWACLVAVALTGAAAAGCGGVNASGASEATGNQLAIYSSLPLHGPSAAIGEEISDGERLALADAGGRAGRFRVGYVSLDDSNPITGKLDPGITAANAKMAAADTSTIAYLGEYGSAATAVSLPLTNAAGILQVSPGSPYVGLTSSLHAGQYEPQRFYPSGKRTFGRLQPGDPGQATAQVQLMRMLGIRSVYVLDDQDPFEIPLAQIVAADAVVAGIAIAGRDSVPVTSTNVPSGELEKIARSGAQAVLFVGSPGPGTVALWRALHGADPRAVLLGSSSLVSGAFTSALGGAETSTYLTTPALPASSYPPAAARVLAEYRRHFGGEGGAYALYGYEAMSVVLATIRRAGAKGNNRLAVIAGFLATRDRASVLGSYSMQPDGETTLARYGVDRVSGGRAVFYRAAGIG
jgi:branched-chain amino acid transport system substrate-binding protein